MDSRARATDAPAAFNPTSTETDTRASVRLVTALPPDAELIARVQDADASVARNAFSLLFTAYWVPLCRWATHFTRDRAVAEELVADVLANVWTRRLSWAPRGSIAAYLYSAVRTQVWYVARTTSRRASLASTNIEPGESPGMGTSFPAPDSGGEVTEVREQLARALATLSGRARAALEFRFYEGLEYPEIAERLGTTEVAVRLLISRAFRTLRTVVVRDE